MNPESNVIEEIVVRGVARRFRPDEQSSATGLNLSLVETPQSVTIITPEMMNTIGAGSAYEATDLVPNVQRSGYGFGLQQVVMRGVFNLSRRVNGLELDNALTSIRGYAVDRLEIVRGPATAIYGVTGAFGGEIQFFSKHRGANSVSKPALNSVATIRVSTQLTLPARSRAAIPLPAALSACTRNTICRSTSKGKPFPIIEAWAWLP
ncbi:MAG: Plug domain-containing protein [Woeseiaceae bacterium]|nr:Plug domain-containing protein [Woeseiaceae bacterium]